MNKKEFAPRDAVYTPAEVSSIGVERVRELEKNKHRAMPLDIAELRDYFAPMMGGQLCAVIAQTSNYKTGFMTFWERQLAKHLEKQGREDEVIVRIDVENQMEDIAFQSLAEFSGQNVGDLARGQVQDWDRLMEAAIKLGSIMVYRIGSSIARAESMPELYLSNMYRSLRYMRDELLGEKVKIAALFVDYLQAFPIDPETKARKNEAQRRLQVRSDIYRLREASAYFDCPVIVGVQAKQTLAGAPGPNMQIPGIYDGEESSAIAQRCDRIIQLWMPKMTHSVGSTIRHKDMSMEVDENLLFVKVGKQRGGLPSGRVWPCRIDFDSGGIAPSADILL